LHATRRRFTTRRKNFRRQITAAGRDLGTGPQHWVARTKNLQSAQQHGQERARDHERPERDLLLPGGSPARSASVAKILRKSCGVIRSGVT
jgi:hypothetical protein